MRGEYHLPPMMRISSRELPPRARRIPILERGHARGRGTTSACAENTTLGGGGALLSGNYLRVRGEYYLANDALKLLGELPPRARRIRVARVSRRSPAGTTSACAENTAKETIGPHVYGNYLRVRGEYSIQIVGSRSIMELPPRARRIHTHKSKILLHKGTTSACAENTSQPFTNGSNIWNYLRVRGEYIERLGGGLDGAELPPRARRIPPPRAPKSGRIGTTSACAENTLNELGLL